MAHHPSRHLAPKSTELLKQGEAALAAGNFIAADDALETALAVDPATTAQLIGQGLKPGDAAVVSSGLQQNLKTLTNDERLYKKVPAHAEPYSIS